MKNTHSQDLLQDQETRQLLKEMILEKADHYQGRAKHILDQHESDYILAGAITEEVIRNLFNSYQAKDESIMIERDLSSMCFQLNKSLNKLSKQTSWEQAYEHATQRVQIIDVITNLTGIINLKRNIPCPFHKDKTPSLKVYPQTNRFICFGCQVRGSPIDFVMKHKDCSFHEAVLYLHNF